MHAATIWFACFQFIIFHVRLQGSEKRNCGWWYQGCEIQSLQFYPFHFLPQNSGKCNCRTGGVIFVQICNISCTCGKSNYIFFLCRFPFPTSKHEKMYVWGVGSLFNSCTCSTSHAPAAIWFACFQFLFSMSHFKVRENEIVGGGIKVVKFSLFSSTLFISYLKTPENVIVGLGVSYLCKFATSRAPAASQITFSSSVVFLFPPQNTRKCRCGVYVL